MPLFLLFQKNCGGAVPPTCPLSKSTGVAFVLRCNFCISNSGDATSQDKCSLKRECAGGNDTFNYPDENVLLDTFLFHLLPFCLSSGLTGTLLQCVCKEKLFCSTNIWKGTKLSVSKDWVECHKCSTSSYWMMSFLLSTFKLRLMLQQLLGHKKRFYIFPIFHYKVGTFLTGNYFQRTQLCSIRWVDSRSVVETWASLPLGFWEFWMARVFFVPQP